MRKASHGFTLIEMLVVTAIIGMVTAVGLTAMGRARESARASSCRRNLRDLAAAAISYSAAHGRYPPGVEQSTFKAAPVYRGVSLFVYLLPYLDHESPAGQWDYDDPLQNTVGDESSRTAVVIGRFLCPADVLSSQRANDGRRIYALTSYGGNGGIRSYFPGAATVDGLFHTTGSASEPKKQQRPVRVQEVRDSLERTIVFGERSHRDPNYETFAAKTGVSALSTWGWWAPSGGRRSIGHVTLAAAAPLNYRHPGPNNAAANADPAYFSDLRLTAYGSEHPGGANVAYAGGNVEFLSDRISLIVLQRLCTRAGDDAPATEVAERY